MHAVLSGVVLAGGASRRMGADKAVLVSDGVRAVDRAVALLASQPPGADGQPLCDDVVVASGDGARLDALAVPQVPDAVVGAGPLGGIVAALEGARHELVAVLAVDLPDASADVLRLLADRWAGEVAVVPRTADGRLQPLHAVWARTAAPALRARLDRGERGVVAACEALGAAVVDVEGPYARNRNHP